MKGLINRVLVCCFQQIKREKALKDELIRELESKELEMQHLLQKQKSVSELHNITIVIIEL